MINGWGGLSPPTPMLNVFVNCAEFPTSAAELGVVFSLFDSHKLGRIHYKEFVDTVMRPDKQVLHFFSSHELA